MCNNPCENAGLDNKTGLHEVDINITEKRLIEIEEVIFKANIINKT